MAWLRQNGRKSAAATEEAGFQSVGAESWLIFWMWCPLQGNSEVENEQMSVVDEDKVKERPVAALFLGLPVGPGRTGRWSGSRVRVVVSSGADHGCRPQLEGGASPSWESRVGSKCWSGTGGLLGRSFSTPDEVGGRSSADSGWTDSGLKM